MDLYKVDISDGKNKYIYLEELLTQHVDYVMVGFGEEIYYVGWDDTVKRPWYRFWFIQDIVTGEYLYKYDSFEEMTKHRFNCGKTIFDNHSELDFYDN